MDKVLLITESLQFIEDNLTEDIKTEDISSALFCSKSSLEKLFKYVTNTSIRDYIIRRRMSLAAGDILKAEDDASFLNLAVKYGYGSNEAFTRAFKSVWYVTPSEYRKNPARYELYPAIRLEPELMEDKSMDGRKKVDISELYDYIKERRNCYFVVADIRSLIPINDISNEAGDMAILTALNRLSAAAGKDDVVFRIGGDEFVILTGSDDKAYADAIIEEVLAHNGETFKWSDKEIPLSLYAASYKIEKSNIRYSELFTNLQNTISDRKYE